MVETKKGYPVAMNLGGPHHYSCKAGPGRPKPDELVQALRVQGYNTDEAKRLAQAARKRRPGADLAGLIVEALAVRAEEL